MIHVLYSILFAAAALCVGYVVLLTLLAATYRRRVDFRASRTRRFAFIVPAHNEEKDIERTLQSFSGIEYPRDLVEVVVIADNCTDRTASVARRSGATVLERTDPSRRGKGHALRWGFDILLRDRSDIEAFVVIDADSVVVPDYLRILNAYIDGGARVCQTSDLVSPDVSGWSGRMSRIGFLLYNYVRPLGRAALGSTVGLRGNGMCFLREILTRHPWDAFTRAEDLEYGLNLLLQGVKVTFVPEATVFARMPEEAKHAVSQRARWEGGRMALIRRYTGPLVSRALGKGCGSCVDSLLDLMTPAMVNLTGVCFLMAFVSGVLLLAGVGWMAFFAVAWSLLGLFGIGHLLVGLWIARAEPSLYRTLLQIPKYALWKISVYLGLGNRRGRGEWVRTSRDS